MAKKVINAFNAGEVSPNVHARTDNELYDSACLKMENFIPLEYGGATRRPATQYVRDLNEQKTVIYPFIFSVSESYIVAFSDLEILVFDKDYNLLSTLESPYLESELYDIKFFQSLDVLFITHKNHFPTKLERRLVDSNFTFSLESVDYSYPPTLEVNTTPTTITTSSKTGETTLTASENLFSLDQEGSVWVFDEPRTTENQTITTLFNATVNNVLQGGVSESLNVSNSNWSVETTGKWAGKVVVERSNNNGTTFEDYVTVGDTLSSTQEETIKNFSFASSVVEKNNTLIRVRFTGGSSQHISDVGCSILLKVDNPYNIAVVRLDSFVSATEFEATVLSPFQSTIQDYNNSHSASKADYSKGDKIEVTAPFSYSGTSIDLANATVAGGVSDNRTDITNIRSSVYDGNSSSGTLYIVTDDGTDSGKYISTYTNSSGTYTYQGRNTALSNAIQASTSNDGFGWGSRKTIFGIDIANIQGNKHIAIFGYRAEGGSYRSTYGSDNHGSQYGVRYYKISDGTVFQYGRTGSVINQYSWYQGGSLTSGGGYAYLFKTNCNIPYSNRINYNGDFNAYWQKIYGTIQYEDSSIATTNTTYANRGFDDGFPAYVDMSYITDSIYALDKDNNKVDQISHNVNYVSSFSVASQVTSNHKGEATFYDGTDFYMIRGDGVAFRYTTESVSKYYECLQDNPTAEIFANQLSKGVWAERYPKMSRWREGAFSVKRGFPEAVAIYENRLVFAGTKNNPNTLWLSETNNFSNFYLTSEDTSALKLTLNSLKQNDIKWLCTGKNLIIGTSGNEWTLSSGSESLPVTPFQFELKRRSEYGSSSTQGVIVNSAVLFLERQKEKLREWFLQGNQQDYLAQDLTFLAEHITKGGIKQIAVQTQPTTIIWMIPENINSPLIGLSYERESKTFAWHRHVFTGTVESVAVLPSENSEDCVYISVKKQNADTRFMCKLDPHHWGYNYQTDFSGLDFYKKYELTGDQTLENAEIELTNVPAGTYTASQDFGAWRISIDTNDPNDPNDTTTGFITISGTDHKTFRLHGSPAEYENAGFLNDDLLVHGKTYEIVFQVVATDINEMLLRGKPATDDGTETGNVITPDGYLSVQGQWMRLPYNTGTYTLRFRAQQDDTVEGDPLPLFFFRKGGGSPTGSDQTLKIINIKDVSFDGLEHLENRSVTVVRDGEKLASTYIVSSGNIYPISDNVNTSGTYYVGLPYTSTLAPLYIDVQGTQGSKKSIQHAVIRFKDTLKAKAGQKQFGTYGENSESVLDDVKFSNPTGLNTEDAEVWLANHNGFLQTVYVVQDEPSPCTVLAMVVDVEGV